MEWLNISENKIGNRIILKYHKMCNKKNVENNVIHTKIID